MMSEEDNITQQSDEIEAVSAIYGDDFSVEDEYLNSYSITINVDTFKVVLSIMLPSDYPSNCPPRYQIEAAWLRGVRRQQLQKQLDQIYIEHVGECVLYLWAEQVRAFLQDLAEVEAATKDIVDRLLEETGSSSSKSREKETIECPDIASGDLIVDRKSVFQPHLARVTSVKEVPVVLSRLKENRKIATATHNIYAYRIKLPSNGVMAQDCEDDGETKAGSRMLHLMDVLGVHNVLVIVTRWYGGCHIGPDRFKHINTATRTILEQQGFLTQQGTSEDKDKKHKKKNDKIK